MYRDSHSEKFQRTEYAVKIMERWYGVSKCQCGQVHAYWVLDPGEEKSMPEMAASDLTSETRENIIRRNFSVNELEKMFAAKEEALSTK